MRRSSTFTPTLTLPFLREGDYAARLPKNTATSHNHRLTLGTDLSRRKVTDAHYRCRNHA